MVRVWALPSGRPTSSPSPAPFPRPQCAASFSLIHLTLIAQYHSYMFQIPYASLNIQEWTQETGSLPCLRNKVTREITAPKWRLESQLWAEGTQHQHCNGWPIALLWSSVLPVRSQSSREYTGEERMWWHASVFLQFDILKRQGTGIYNPKTTSCTLSGGSSYLGRK